MKSIENIVVFKVTSEFFEENGYIVYLEGKTDAVVFDPGSDVDQFLSYLSKKNLAVDAICLTHAHPDHIAGVSGLKTAFPDAKISIGINEAAALTDPKLNLSALLGFEMVAPLQTQPLKMEIMRTLRILNLIYKKYQVTHQGILPILPKIPKSTYLVAISYSKEVLVVAIFLEAISKNLSAELSKNCYAYRQIQKFTQDMVQQQP